jgi:hypothetical protein
MEEINKVIVKQQPKLTGQIGNTLIYIDPDLEDKSIDITKNGLYTITADDGYDALNVVEINANVTSKPEKGFVVNEWTDDGFAKKITVVGYDKVPDFAFSGYTYNSYACMSLIVKKLEEIVLDENVTSLGKGCFYNAPALTKINLDNITTLSESTFANCWKLSITDFPEKVTSLSWSPFERSGVKFKTLPNLQYISNGGFSGCTGLTQLSMPKMRSTSDQGSSTAAFYNCSNLKAVWIGDKMSDFSRYTFQNCNKLSKMFINLPRAKVEAMREYPYAFMYNTAKVGIIVCNDDEGFMTQEEFDAIDWATYTG